MPLYEYQCDACGKRFEAIQKFSDPAVEICRLCGQGPVRRLLSSPAIQFKGSGWYITDYAQKGKNDGSKGGSDKPAGDTAKADGAKPDSNATSASKSDTKSDGAASSTTKAPAKSAD